MTVTAHFASLRSDLIVVERPAIPQYEGGQLVATKAGKYHQFRDHHCTIEGQKSIDYLRERMKAHDGPGLWEINASDVPDVVSLLAELATAPIERVRDMLAAEEAGPNRAEVVTTCRAVLNRAGAAEQGPGAQKQKPRHEVVTG
jgi:hypothetical protein